MNLKHTLLACTSTVLLSITSASLAETPPALPQPTKEHAWLAQFAGEWDTETIITTEPGQPPLKATGHETARMLGGFWVMAENKGVMFDQSYVGVMTLGYDPEAKQYVGTWVDSNTSQLWNYRGMVDATGKILTLETKGRCSLEEEVCECKDVVEFKTPDERVMTSSRKGKDGQWTVVMTMTAKRRK